MEHPLNSTHAEGTSKARPTDIAVGRRRMSRRSPPRTRRSDVTSLQPASHMEAGVNHEHFPGDGARGGTQQEERGIGHLALIDAAAKRSLVAVDLEKAREAGNT